MHYQVWKIIEAFFWWGFGQRACILHLQSQARKLGRHCPSCHPACLCLPSIIPSLLAPRPLPPCSPSSVSVFLCVCPFLLLSYTFLVSIPPQCFASLCPSHLTPLSTSLPPSPCLSLSPSPVFSLPPSLTLLLSPPLPYSLKKTQSTRPPIPRGLQRTRFPILAREPALQGPLSTQNTRWAPEGSS